MKEAAILYAAQYAGNGQGMIYGLGGWGLLIALAIVLVVAFIGILLDIF